MYDEKAIELVQVALSKSKAKEMLWEISPQGEDIYVHKFPSGFVLRAFPHTEYQGSGEGPPSLSLFDPGGQMILDITSEIVGVNQDDLSYLYELARRAAEGIDQKLDAVLEELKNTSDVPF